MIEIFEYLQHFQRQVEIFKKHVNTGISSFHNTGFAECLRKDTDERVQGGVQIQKKLTLQTLNKGHVGILIFLEGAQLTACPFNLCF